MQQHEVIWMYIGFWDLSFHSEEKGSIFVQNWHMYIKHIAANAYQTYIAAFSPFNA